VILENRHFNFLQSFIKNESGIALTADKNYLIESRLKSVLRKHNLESYDELISKISQFDEYRKLREEVIDAVTTNETYFFRDIKPFKFFEDNILKPFAKQDFKKVLRIWCAASSTGQEPYSLAIQALENKLLLKDKRVEIIATDINQQVIDKAREGNYNQFEVQRGLPINLLLKYFDQIGDDANNFKLKNEVKNLVTFKKLNLLDDYSSVGVLDAIFCRNVLIYFDIETKNKIMGKMAGSLNRGGFVFLGTSETNLEIPGRLVQNEEMRSVYLKV
jgi:chemotaxis protein methyltransferase CheR